MNFRSSGLLPWVACASAFVALVVGVAVKRSYVMRLQATTIETGSLVAFLPVPRRASSPLRPPLRLQAGSRAVGLR